MKLSITNSGLKGITKEHGLTEYWAHRITYCASPPEFPKVFCWVYRHEGRKLKHELRCHAVLCTKESVSKKIATDLKFKIKQALFEFKRDKLAKQNARLSLANSVYENPSMPRRKILLSVGGNNYKPPLERSKSAPKLMAIEEMCSEEDEEEMTMTGDRSTNTWTKDNSLKLCCQPEDIFPSYTLGRRKCDKKCYRKNLPENRFKTMGSAFRKSEGSTNNAVAKDNETNINSETPPIDSPSEDTCDERYPHSSQRVSNPNHHVSFSLSTMSDSSEINTNPKHSSDDHSDDTEDDVFYCETEENLYNQEKTQPQKEDEISINGMDQLCVQTNFLVLDSDEGSISSGCETSSTVTSSDIEMTSLPCNFTTNEFKSYPEEPEKISVLERVQSFEQLFSRERSNSMRNFRSLNKGNFRYAGGFRTSSERSEDSETTYSAADSLSYSPSTDSGATSCGDEVNLVPLGEKTNRLDSRPSYLRCSTYPPSDDEANVSSFDSHEFDSREDLADDVCGASDMKGVDFEGLTKPEGEKQEEDSDSACSVESGYSELLDGGGAQHDCVIASSVCV